MPLLNPLGKFIAPIQNVFYVAKFGTIFTRPTRILEFSFCVMEKNQKSLPNEFLDHLSLNASYFNPVLFKLFPLGGFGGPEKDRCCGR